MNIVSDRDFGELHFDGVWTGLCEVVVFGSRFEVELVVQAFDAAPISEAQRLAFREFNLNKASITSLVEEAVFNYCRDRLGECRECFDADEVDARAPRVCAVNDMQGLVYLRRVKVMSAFNSEVRQIGFIFDAKFDPQLGLGGLVTNGSVEAVDTQDFLLG